MTVFAKSVSCIAIAAGLVLAGCSNSSDKKVPLAPIDDNRSPLSGGLIGQITSTNEVENTGNAGQSVAPKPVISNETKFSSAAYGVAGSPRVATTKRVRKGGGRYQVGKPYTIRGRRYVPRVDPNYKATGLASWYGPNFHGRLTANGEIYDQFSLSAAHPTMPLPSYAKVTNLENGSSVTVRVNDRGPFARNRIIDLSARAAELLGYTKKGLAKVKVEYVGKARMDGLDEKTLLASYNPGRLNPNSIPGYYGGTVLVAQADTSSSRPNATRRSLNVVNAVGFAAPVPQSRPIDPLAGFPVNVTAVSGPRPTGLVQGYSEFAGSTTKGSVFDRFDNTTEAREFSRIRIGPIENSAKLDQMIGRLSEFGPVNTLEVSKTGAHTLILIHAPESGNEISRVLALFGFSDPR